MTIVLLRDCPAYFEAKKRPASFLWRRLTILSRPQHRIVGNKKPLKSAVVFQSRILDMSSRLGVLLSSSKNLVTLGKRSFTTVGYAIFAIDGKVTRQWLY